jgi:ketosteroid isomerase-like protein
MKPHFVILLLAVLSLAAPIHTAPAQSASSRNPSDSAQQVSSVLQEWSKDWKARDADSISALYAQDAVVYPAVDGPGNPRDYFRQLFERLADPKIGDIMGFNSAQVAGDMAFDDGGIQYLVKGKCHQSDPGNGPCVLKGYNLTVLRRDSDGRWLILRQSFSQIGLGSTIYKSR